MNVKWWQRIFQGILMKSTTFSILITYSAARLSIILNVYIRAMNLVELSHASDRLRLNRSIKTRNVTVDLPKHSAMSVIKCGIRFRGPDSVCQTLLNVAVK